LQAYKKHLAAMQAHGAAVLAISPQTPDNSLTMAEKNELPFEVLSDVGNQAARQFGLVFALVDELRPLYDQIGAKLSDFNGDSSYELPIPATYVIGQDGVIRLAYVDADYTHRLEPADIIDSLAAL